MLKQKSLFSMMYERVCVSVRIAYNMNTNHIGVYTGRSYCGKYYDEHHAEIAERGRKYRVEHHEEKLARDREYYSTHRKEAAAYRVVHRARIGKNNQKYRMENQDRIRSLRRTSHNNPERKRRNYIRIRDRYHVKLSGVCSVCNLRKDTERHHLWYPDIFDPNAVIEVCKDCHRDIENEKYLKSI